MRNSLEDWTRVPTTASALFGIDLPYRPPKNRVGAYLWRWRLWIETTIGLSLLEPWEKILVLTIIYLLLTLVLTGLYKLPQQATLVHRRLLYYFFGNEDVDIATNTVRHLVADWSKLNVSAAAARAHL
ncbi:hypothetical protein BV20DRAFT_950525 [Pilatotrama ljubarskyi]|nr:hypothetical protein BV20DRAFT_950525 [Pilatotrama ljubarskyi]